LFQAREKFLGKVNVKMSVWEAVEMLETLVDDSDPDTLVQKLFQLGPSSSESLKWI